MAQIGRLTLETPEQVEVSFDLAGPGSRFCAVLIDMLIMGLLLFGMIAVFIILAMAGPIEDPTGVGWMMAVAIVLFALIAFGYHLFFELVMRGRTPGKKMFRLRVVRDNGTPAGAMEILIRNLVRIVDSLPSFYVLGGLVAWLHPMHKRLGDIAAGTVVINEQAPEDVPASFHSAWRPAAAKMPPAAPAPPATGAGVADAVASGPGTGGAGPGGASPGGLVSGSAQAASGMVNPALSAEERRIITSFFERAADLEYDRRTSLAAQIATSLRRRHGGAAMDPERYLGRLLEGTHHEP